MEGRWFQLALRAFTKGILDFTDTAGPRSLWRETLVLDQLEIELVIEMNKLAHLWHSSAAQITGWDEHEELFEFHQRHMREAHNVIGKAALPWYKTWKAGKTLADQWREFLDAEKDPAFAAKLKKLRQEVRDKAEKGKGKTISNEALANIFKNQSEQRKALQKRRMRRMSHGKH